MRFHANGPILPLELLEERDNGNVVFFCGAGVSRPTLPGFLQLAQQVVEQLQPREDAPLRTLLARAETNVDFAPPLDQIFNLLQQEYGVGAIEDVVSQLLRTPANASVEHHSLVLRLSRNAVGSPQIVTTNFDLLFERACRSLRTYKPPSLPDLASGQPLDGLVYLHGRRASAPTGGISRQGLILSSADFGRAYLADGWATRFVRELLRNYVIVLLGYSANDPPVRYLLEGLHSRAESRSAGIFAFDQGTEAEVMERWKNRGVQPLAYPSSDRAHSALWDTLHAWAHRADDPDAWRRTIVAMAIPGPRELQPYERGQVAALTSTPAGARIFADADPAPPAEWLCVFDRSARYAEPRAHRGEGEEFDPLACYGLDDDPPRPPSRSTGRRRFGDDVISLLPSDEQHDHRNGLAGGLDGSNDPLPPRLHNLSRWIANVLSEPTAAWWAALFYSLHPALVTQIEWRLERSGDDLHERAYTVWALLLEKFRSPSAHLHDDRWYSFTPKLKKQGWNARMLRELELVLDPYLHTERSWLRAPQPPLKGWCDLTLSDIAEWKVKFPVCEGAFPVPTERLPDVFRIARRALERAAGLLAEIETRYWHSASLHPKAAEDDADEVFINGADRYFHWVAKLFDCLAAEHPAVARHELQRWPKDDLFFFTKLKIYAWMKSDVFSASEVAAGLIGLSPDILLAPDHRRELLHTLRARWNDFSIADAAVIETAIMAGSKSWQSETDADFQTRTAITAAIIFGWLVLHGCRLTEETHARLLDLRSADPQWQASWDEEADDSHEPRGGVMRVETDPSKIIDVPISELIALAERNTTQDYRKRVRHNPFLGLVKQRPARVLAALAYEGRQQRYPVAFWRTAISEWPDQTSQRLEYLLANRVAGLPPAIMAQLAHCFPDWLDKHLPSLARSDRDRALALWDRIVCRFSAAGADATRSGIVSSGFERDDAQRSRRTYDHAINGPVGHMAAVLFRILDDLKISGGGGIPTDISRSLLRLFQMPGEGGDHAVSHSTLRVRWLHHVDPTWVGAQLIPFFNPDHPFAEPAWSGYLHDTALPAPELFALLKPHFLQLFSLGTQWHWRSGTMNRLSEFLVLATNWNKDADYVTFAEARSALQLMDDNSRVRAAAFLTQIVKVQSCWKSFGKPFVQRAWPRETRYQTEAVSREFAGLAEVAGDHFPDVVQTVISLLVPARQIEMVLHRMKKGWEGEDGLAVRFPDSCLALLDRLVPEDMPATSYALAPVVNIIATAAPHLRQDHRWKRLNNIVHHR